jgi:outer membrane lipoprotein-sorting protein
MLRFFLTIIFFFLTLNSNADVKKEIIQNLKNTQNLDFKFEQNINGKIENGNCTIEYPKKIFCEYAGSNNKILVSNGKSLVIKTSVSYYRYPLEKTPLNLILDKDYLINKIL